MMVQASRLREVSFSNTLAMNQRAGKLASQGREVISLGIGEPFTEVPKSIRDAAARAAERGEGRSPPVDGIANLRARVAAKLRDVNGIACEPAQVQITSGSKQAIFNAMMATLNPGDEVIIPAPYWVSYPEIVRLASGSPVVVSCSKKQDYKLLPEQLEAAITPKTRWLVLNSPNNPTGAVYSSEELAALAEVLRRHPQILILSDEIYEFYVYSGDAAASFAAVAPDLAERTLTVNGFSKSYSMIGWRIGYAAGAKDLIDAMSNVQSHMTSGTATIVQAGAIAALETISLDWLKGLGATYNARCDMAISMLADVEGMEVVKPGGAFYLYPDCSKLIGKRTREGTLIGTDTDLADYLLESRGVVTVPGSAFGHGPALRLSLTCEQDKLARGLTLIREAVSELN